MNLDIVGKRLTVTKGKHVILDGIDFTVKAGMLTGLIGPSGSGKTTLLRTIVGIQIPSDGSLMIGQKQASAKELRASIGYVTQSPSVYEDVTVLQNLTYFAALKKATKQQIHEALSQVHLDKQAKQVVSTLSGGQRARVSLAIALLGNPEVLILDEPTVGLDPLLRMQLWQLFRRFADEGKTILISSHVMDEADKCDDVLLLRDGTLLWSDSRKELLRDTKTDSTEAAFLKKVEEVA